MVNWICSRQACRRPSAAISLPLALLGLAFVLSICPRAAGLTDPEVECIIIYWENGISYRDGEEAPGAQSMIEIARKLQDFHQNTQTPATKTLLISIEDIRHSYGGAGQPPLAGASPGVTGWQNSGQDGYYAPAGWDTVETDDDVYDHDLARAILAFVKDAVDGSPDPWDPNPPPDNHDLPNFAYLVLLGNANKVPPSFYYWQDLWWIEDYGYWMPTDFYYMTQGTGGYETTPKRGVGRIPGRFDPDGGIDEITPAVDRIIDWYNESILAWAWDEWFRKITLLIDGRHFVDYWRPPITETYTAWLLNQKVPDDPTDPNPLVGRDIFTGLSFRKYRWWNTIADEQLTEANVKRHLDGEAPAFANGWFLHISTSDDETNMHVRDTLDGGVPGSEELTAAEIRAYDPAAAFQRQPIVVSTQGLAARYDPLTRIRAPSYSIGTAFMASGAGAVAFIGTTGQLFTDSAPNFIFTRDEGRYEYTSVEGLHAWVPLFFREFTTSPAFLGDVFMRSVSTFVEEFGFTNQQEPVEAILGLHLLGDPCLRLPGRQAWVADFASPRIEAANPRAAMDVNGYTSQTSFNSRNFPVYVKNQGQATADVRFNIVTNSPEFRARMLHPFEHVAAHDLAGQTAVEELGLNPDNGYQYDAPQATLYFLHVEQKSPEDTYYKEALFEFQVVDQFVNDPNVKILVVDMDQQERWREYNGGGSETQNDRQGDYEVAYVDPRNSGSVAADHTGYAGAMLVMLNARNKLGAVVAAGNAEADRYLYQYWDMDHYDSKWAPASSDGKRYGELTPEILEQVQDKGGAVLLFFGDDIPAITGTGGARMVISDYHLLSYLDTTFLGEFQENGGHIFVSYPDLWNDDQAGSTVQGWVGSTLLASGGTQFTGYSVLHGLQQNTPSEQIDNVSLVGGDGDGSFTEANPANETGQGVQAYEYGTSGDGAGVANPGSTTITQVTNPNGSITTTYEHEGRTLWFAFPWSSIDHLGDINDRNGRWGVAAGALDWLLQPWPEEKPVGVTGFEAERDGANIELKWRNPANLPRFAGVIIRFRTDDFPTDRFDGELVIRTAGAAGASMTFTHVGTDPALDYYYAAIAFTTRDASYADAAAATATTDPTATGGGGGGSVAVFTCFIATAAAETAYNAAGVDVADATGVHRVAEAYVPALQRLRAFRDDVLLSTADGRQFVGWYYALSPFLADGIRGSTAAKRIVRGLIVSPGAEAAGKVTPVMP